MLAVKHLPDTAKLSFSDAQRKCILLTLLKHNSKMLYHAAHIPEARGGSTAAHECHAISDRSATRHRHARKSLSRIECSERPPVLISLYMQFNRMFTGSLLSTAEFGLPAWGYMQIFKGFLQRETKINMKMAQNVPLGSRFIIPVNIVLLNFILFCSSFSVQSLWWHMTKRDQTLETSSTSGTSHSECQMWHVFQAVQEVFKSTEVEKLISHHLQRKAHIAGVCTAGSRGNHCLHTCILYPNTVKQRAFISACVAEKITHKQPSHH